MQIFSFLLGIVITVSVNADIYRSVDEDGNIVFSDTETPEAEKIEIQETQTIQLPETEPFKYTPPPAVPREIYQSVNIASPQHETSVRQNDGNLSVGVAVVPELQPGHQLVLYLDGKQVQTGTSPSFDLINLDRGTHTLRVSIKDARGRIIISSKSVTFHLLRRSVLHP